MDQNLSRRDFLKLAGVGLGALAFNPYRIRILEDFSTPKRLPQFPASPIIGRVLEPGIDLRNQPTNDESLNSSIAKLDADTLVEWGRQVVGNVIGRVVAEQDEFNALHAHNAVGFGPAPIVADAHADIGAERAPDREAQIAGLEVALLEMLKRIMRAVVRVAG